MKKKSYILFALLVLAIILAGIFSYKFSAQLFSNPFNRVLLYENPSYAVTDHEGNNYVIDRSMRRIVKIDGKGNLSWIIEGGSRDTGSFFYAYEIAVDENGKLYVLNGVLDSEGFFMLREEIIRYSSGGKFEEVIYSKSYGPDERKTNLVQRGQFTGLRTDKQAIEWFDIDGKGIQSIRIIQPQGSLERSTGVYLSNANILVSGAVRLNDRSIVYSTKKGMIYRSKDHGEGMLMYSADEHKEGLSIPWWVGADSKGNIYFTDLGNRTVSRIKPDKSVDVILSKEKIEKAGFQTGRFIYYRLSINKAGMLTTCNDYFIVVMSPDGRSIARYSDGGELSLKNVILKVLMWAVFAIAVLWILISGTYIYLNILKRRIPLMVKQVLIFVPMLVVSVAIPANLIIEDFAGRYKSELTKKISLMVQVAPKVINTDDLEKITRHEDYLGESYNRVRTSLLGAFNYSSDEWNRGFYFVIYRVYDDNIYGCMYLNGGIGIYYPFTYFDDPESIYRSAYKGEIVTESVSDVWGSWLYGVGPIYNKDGKVTALIEVGTDLYSYTQANNRLVLKMILRIGIITVLFVILLTIVTYILLVSIKRLSTGVTRLSKGEWETKVEIGKRNDEVSDLARGFNRMSEYILNYINEIVHLNKGYQRFVPEQFLHYLDKESVTQVQLGDQVQKIMTVMFSDIRSFTSLSENMTPKENFDFLNSYLKHVGPVIRKNNGFIDKYIGDAVMALFPHSADDALEAAVGMFENLYAFNEERIKKGDLPIEIGLGLHTGQLMMGIIGEEERMEGTVISDNVNFASRLEGLTKHYGARILISEMTHSMLAHPERYLMRNLGKVRVKGKNDPVAVFEVLDPLPFKQKSMKIKTKDVLEKGIMLYQQKRFTEAIEKFNKILAVDKEDKVVIKYYNAASAYAQKVSVSEDWDGTLEMREK
ncbi:MAG TPA: adenylate/guanylate cyclase domain-containing protein [Spirochaetota bacterium]|nr:adenylate/guanylate cyclase domain-containing protein [Spirochaetota bacterium]